MSLLFAFSFLFVQIFGIDLQANMYVKEEGYLIAFFTNQTMIQNQSVNFRINKEDFNLENFRNNDIQCYERNQNTNIEIFFENNSDHYIIKNKIISGQFSSNVWQCHLRLQHVGISNLIESFLIEIEQEEEILISEDLSFSISVDQFTSSQIIFSSLTTLETNSIQIKFQPSFEFPLDGYLKIYLPQVNKEFQDVLSQEQLIDRLQFGYTCTGLSGNIKLDSLDCILNENYLEIRNFHDQENINEKENIIEITNFINSYSLAEQKVKIYIQDFFIESYAKNGGLINKSFLFFQLEQVQQIQNIIISTLSDVIKEYTDITFKFTPSLFYGPKSKILIQFPYEFELSNGKKSNLEINYYDFQSSLSRNGYVQNNQIMIEVESYTFESDLYYKLLHVKNYAEVKKSQSFFIEIIDEQGFQIEKLLYFQAQVQNLTYETTPGKVKDIQISPISSIYDEFTEYEFEFRLSNNLDNDSVIKIKFSDNLFIEDKQDQLCDPNLIHQVQNLPIDSQCYIFNNELQIQGDLSKIVKEETISFTLKSIRNSYVNQTSFINIESFKNNIIHDKNQFELDSPNFNQTGSILLNKIIQQKQIANEISKIQIDFQSSKTYTMDDSLKITFSPFYKLEMVQCFLSLQNQNKSLDCQPQNNQIVINQITEFLSIEKFTNFVLYIENIQNPRFEINDNNFEMLVYNSEINKDYFQDNIDKIKSQPLNNLQIIFGEKQIHKITYFDLYFSIDQALIIDDQIYINFPESFSQDDSNLQLQSNIQIKNTQINKHQIQFQIDQDYNSGYIYQIQIQNYINPHYIPEEYNFTLQIKDKNQNQISLETIDVSEQFETIELGNILIENDSNYFGFKSNYFFEIQDTKLDKLEIEFINSQINKIQFKDVHNLQNINQNGNIFQIELSQNLSNHKFMIKNITNPINQPEYNYLLLKFYGYVNNQQKPSYFSQLLYNNTFICSEKCLTCQGNYDFCDSCYLQYEFLENQCFDKVQNIKKIFFGEHYDKNEKISFVFVFDNWHKLVFTNILIFLIIISLIIKIFLLKNKSFNTILYYFLTLFNMTTYIYTLIYTIKSQSIVFSVLISLITVIRLLIQILSSKKLISILDKCIYFRIWTKTKMTSQFFNKLIISNIDFQFIFLKLFEFSDSFINEDIDEQIICESYDLALIQVKILSGFTFITWIFLFVTFFFSKQYEIQFLDQIFWYSVYILSQIIFWFELNNKVLDYFEFILQNPKYKLSVIDEFEDSEIEESDSDQSYSKYFSIQYRQTLKSKLCLNSFTEQSYLNSDDQVELDKEEITIEIEQQNIGSEKKINRTSHQVQFLEQIGNNNKKLRKSDAQDSIANIGFNPVA